MTSALLIVLVGRKWWLGTDFPFVHLRTVTSLNLMGMKKCRSQLYYSGFEVFQFIYPYWDKAYLYPISFIRRILPLSYFMLGMDYDLFEIPITNWCDKADVWILKFWKASVLQNLVKMYSLHIPLSGVVQIQESKMNHNLT